MWRGLRGALLAGVGALVAACGSGPPATFHPEGANPAEAGGAAGPSSSRLAQTASQRVTWPRSAATSTSLCLPGFPLTAARSRR